MLSCHSEDSPAPCLLMLYRISIFIDGSNPEWSCGSTSIRMLLHNSSPVEFRIIWINSGDFVQLWTFLDIFGWLLKTQDYSNSFWATSDDCELLETIPDDSILLRTFLSTPGDSECLCTTLDNSARFWNTPDDSGRLWMTSNEYIPDSSGWLRTNRNDSGELRMISDDAGRLEMAPAGSG